MIIDTEKLEASMDDYYEKRSTVIDENIKNDRQAIRMLTELEIQEIKEKKIISAITKLAKKYL